jgi:hypothetical protein
MCVINASGETSDLVFIVTDLIWMFNLTDIDVVK